MNCAFVDFVDAMHLGCFCLLNLVAFFAVKALINAEIFWKMFFFCFHNWSFALSVNCGSGLFLFAVYEDLGRGPPRSRPSVHWGQLLGGTQHFCWDTQQFLKFQKYPHEYFWLQIGNLVFHFCSIIFFRKISHP